MILLHSHASRERMSSWLRINSHGMSLARHIHHTALTQVIVSASAVSPDVVGITPVIAITLSLDNWTQVGHRLFSGVDCYQGR